MKAILFKKLYVLAIFLICLPVFAEYGSQTGNRVLSGLGSDAKYVNIADDPAFDQTADGTIEMWIYPTNLVNNPVMISKGATTNVSFLYAITSQGLQKFRIGATDFVNTGGSVIQTNRWTHVAVTWSVTAGIYTVTFYVNGSLSSVPAVGAATWDVNDDAVRIAVSQSFVGSFWQGDIDEVRYWDDVRTQTEIRDNRFTGLGDGSNANSGGAITAGLSYNGLISSWTFNSTLSATDDISGHHGTYTGSAASTATLLGVPVPYNLVMYVPGAQDDYVKVPDNDAFDQNTDGSIEAWIYPTTLNNNPVIISKGAGADPSFMMSITNTGVLKLRIGGTDYINTGGTAIDVNKWTHTAVTWSGGPNFMVTFYVNGSQSGAALVQTAQWNFNADAVRIGGSESTPEAFFTGYIDELRFWGPALSDLEIKSNLFASGRSLNAGSSLIGLWNFEGNVKNGGSTAGINGSLNNGAVNHARFSGFLNETTAGTYGTNFTSHPTVINRALTPNPFPTQYSINEPFVTVPDNNINGLTNSIVISQSGTFSSVEVFLSIKHPAMLELTVRLTAPNGQERNLLLHNGTNGDHALTFFNDSFTTQPNSDIYLPPWGFLKPMDALGTFAGSPIQGTWVLKVIDDAAGNQGTLEGWGLKFTSNLTGIEAGNNSPGKFSLEQNYPNPFNSSSKFKFEIAKLSNVKVTLFDVLGREIVTLVNGKLNQGSYIVTFDGTGYPSGVYFYRLTAQEGYSETKKMIMIK